METDTAVAGEFAHRYEAELAQGYLDSAGIQSIVTMDDASTVDTGMTFPRPARLLVLKVDLERAIKVLQQANVLDS